METQFLDIVKKFFSLANKYIRGVHRRGQVHHDIPSVGGLDSYECLQVFQKVHFIFGTFASVGIDRQCYGLICSEFTESLQSLS